MITERRKFPRFKNCSDIMVEVNPYAKKVGNLLDISRDGLAFQYIDVGDDVDEISELSLWIDNEIYLIGINTEKVSDCKTFFKSPTGSIPMRRCSVRFDTQSPNQQSLLESFINKYTFQEDTSTPKKKINAKSMIQKEDLDILLQKKSAELEAFKKKFKKVINKQGQTEKALKDSEERYERICKAVTDYIFTVRIENGSPVETFHGAGCVAVTGYMQEDFVSDFYLWFRMVYEKDRNMVHEQVRRVLSGNEAQPVEHRIIRKDGAVRWVKNTLVPYYDPTGKLLSYDGLIRDIHDRKVAEEEKERFEAQFQQAQKMEAVGTLAGGMAHDFNNLLMGIQGRISLMQMNSNIADCDIGHLKGIEECVESAANLTRQLLGFARGGQYEVKPTDLNELIKSQNRMFGRTMKEITIRGKYKQDLLTVEVDQSQIKQTLLNIYLNAWHAMPGGGTLDVKTENVIIDEEYIKPFLVNPGKYVKLSIIDTGVGMDKDVLEKIFEPFFTTKEMGRGTGLGLASVYGIVKNHGGFVEVKSKKNIGTTFDIYLPASEKPVIQEKILHQEIKKGNGTILFVDDENMIIDVAEGMIRMLGYDVLTASCGKEAVQKYQENHERIDLVILDLVMPGMSGEDTFKKLKTINKNISVILSSGYSMNCRAKKMVDLGCKGFIQKPYTVKELSNNIVKLLDLN